MHVEKYPFMYPVYPKAQKITKTRITTRIISVILSTKLILSVGSDVAVFTKIIGTESVCSDVTTLVVDIVFWASVVFLIDAVEDGGVCELHLAELG